MNCHCGKPLHYTDKKIEAQLMELCKELGDYMKVNVGGRTWKVQRHYVALHGIKGKDIASLGFTELKEEQKR